MNSTLRPTKPPFAETGGPLSTTFWPEWSSRVMFENKGIDVEIKAQVAVGKPKSIPDHELPPALRCLADDHTFTIEIKPTVGDDYPTVLRQMLAGKVRYLFLERYTGTGADLGQFLDIFEASGRTVIFKDDVDEEHRRLLRSLEPDDDWDGFRPSFDFDTD